MSKQSQTANTQEISIELSEQAQDALAERLQETQWVERPLREAATYLEQECARFFDLGCPEHFFAAKYLIQTTDEARFRLPVVELLGVLFVWETQISDSGKELFKERVESLLTLMRTMPPEQDQPLLALLYAIDPRTHQIMLQFASQFASNLASQAARKAADAKHDEPGGSREKRDKMRDVWASGNYLTKDKCAEDEYKNLGFKSFATARKALRNM